MRPLAEVRRLALEGGRWWAGLTYVLGGLGLLVAAPVMLAKGDGGGFYMLLAGPEIAFLGWLIHPWGLQRTRRRRRQAAATVSR